MGTNLMVHLRKNVGFSAPLPAGVSDAELSALLVRCRANLSGTPAHFHLQITAFADPSGTAACSEPYLFQSVPDLDHIRQIAAMGLAVTPPSGWEASIYRRAATDGGITYPVVHAATVALPSRQFYRAREWYGHKDLGRFREQFARSR